MIEADREIAERSEKSGMFLIAPLEFFSGKQRNRVLDKVWPNGPDAEILCLLH
jgi:hypothetical protein